LLKRNHLLFLLFKKPFPQCRRFEPVLSELNGFVLGRVFPNELLQIAKLLLERHDNVVLVGLSSNVLVELGNLLLQRLDQLILGHNLNQF
jgi:hypothetical protein